MYHEEVILWHKQFSAYFVNSFAWKLHHESELREYIFVYRITFDIKELFWNFVIFKETGAIYCQLCPLDKCDLVKSDRSEE